MYPEALVDYLVYFHADRDYFECHEILEEYWKSLPSETRSDLWVGLIQIAVGLYHHRRGNFVGAEKMINSAIKRLNAGELDRWGFAGKELIDRLIIRKKEIHERRPYEDMDLPLHSKRLLLVCESRCAERNVCWLSQSDLQNEFLIHKHKLRDRSEVLAEREAEIRRRKNSH
jgi:predicted metal-dependent hydrolase